MRWFAARLQQLPSKGKIFKNRDIDLFLRIVRVESTIFKEYVDVEYGTFDQGVFKKLPGRHVRTISKFKLHYHYDEA